MGAERVVIVGGPGRGKSSLAEQYRARGVPVFCGDPRSTARTPSAGVTYIPEGLAFSGDGGAGDWVATHWLGRPGPWVCEGHVMARALRRWIRLSRGAPCELVVVLAGKSWLGSDKRHEAMHRGVLTVLSEIQPALRSVGVRFETVT